MPNKIVQSYKKMQLAQDEPKGEIPQTETNASKISHSSTGKEQAKVRGNTVK